ncbi:protocatechuate 3,4-dioxygenase subunit beta [Streptomyces sp. B-S-A8]|uniref:Protocatechuate 3,4-dioxygenase subunit beta n=1 Tax=Streptomyces solicavernae TaxID=3043614 RepID=A0ABT6RTU2_9ACTN|nr:protocatechuate 3,4-dioxygenase subunit beta [Streptomyces sp. B-S-A8]MDI3387852.1 protocatechuate 3,4-dioxygenase subunit beta [Streptomyces sp. B-S-A8]
MPEVTPETPPETTRSPAAPLPEQAPVQRELTQADIDRQIARERQAYEKDLAGGAEPRHHPPRDYAPYRSSILRHPTQPPVAIDTRLDPEAVELSSPAFGRTDVTELDSDLTRQHQGEPLGERITVSGRLLDRDGRPVRGQLIELWQANASGRYAHQRDQHPAPLDPNFTGVGRVLTGDDGSYSFTTVKPGAYPWRNHANAWRPAHIHFSLFGTAFTQRLVTQMYFPGDPLFAYDPILQSVTDEAARARLVAAYDHDLSRPEWSLGYRWDIVLDGPAATWIEEGR